MASGGVGRGGRGAALLKALSQPPRKPGESHADSQSQHDKPFQSLTQDPVVPPPVSVTPKETRPGGRGQFLASLLKNGKPAESHKQQQVAEPPQPRPPPTQPSPNERLTPRPMGRGMNVLMAALLASGESLPQPSPPSHPPTTSQHVSSQQTTTQPPGASPLTTTLHPAADVASDLKRLTLDPRERPRRDTVSFRGEGGKPLAVAVNYVRINCLNHAVYQYHVSYIPEIDNKNIRFKILNGFREVIGETRAFDGSILYLPIKLENQETVLEARRPTDDAHVQLRIKYVKAIPPQQCVHVYNVIFKRILRILELKQIGRYYYNPHTPTSVPQHKLEMWPGYITSVKEHEGGLLMLADASHRVLRTETVLDYIYSVIKRNNQGFQDIVTKGLIGAVVLTRYNNQTYRVDDIAWDKNPRQTFLMTSSGLETSFIKYYKDHHGKEINDHDQPLLLHRPKKRGSVDEKGDGTEVICLVPELCYMTGLTDEMRQDFKIMKDIAVHTRITPNQRQMALRKFVSAVTSNPDANNELLMWGLSLDTDTLNIQGRQVINEKIHFLDNTIHVNAQADWSREMTRSCVIRAVPLHVWTVVYTKRDARRAGDFVRSMSTSGPRMGIEVHEPSMVELMNDRTDTFVNALRESINSRLQIVVIICPTSRDDRYAAIKKICCVENPIPSQVINAKTLSVEAKLHSVVQKVALQMNCKLGGELWAVDIPLKNLMVVGIDVYHCINRRSVGAFVASINPAVTRWFSRAVFQQPQQELIDQMQICFSTALKKYHEVNHCLPDRIVVFRDGVGDGQLSMVSEYEVKQLLKSFSLFESGYQPKISFVVVQKRINTRIFLKTQGGSLDNPPPGAVVDHTITHRELYDFFLVSQHVRQGTVTPTHYIVVHDNSGMKPDHMQRLAYKMTHMYYNWPGTVRVPAPCQYAHKLAYLVGQSIGKDPSHELSDRLFFL